MRIAGIALSIVLVASCGGQKNGGATDTTNTTTKPAEPSERDKALAKLKRQQDATCGPMCERITDCAVEDARAKMSPKDLADLKLEQTAPMHTQKCVEDCEALDLSPRQIKTMRSCITDVEPCAEYAQCLKQAEPKPSAMVQ